MKAGNRQFGLGVVVALALTLWAGATRAQTNTVFDLRYQALMANRANLNENDRLREMFKIRWEYLMEEFPEMATDTGYPGQNGRWTDNSVAAIERRKRDLQVPLKIIQAIDRSRLDAANRLNFDLFQRELELDIEGTRFKGEYLALNQMGGVQQDAPNMFATIMPRQTAADYEDMLARLRGLPVLISQTTELLKLGLAAGVTPARITLRDVPAQVESQLVTDPAKSTLLKPFMDFPAGIPAAEQARLRGEATAVLTNAVVPAFRQLRDFLVKTYIPGAREGIAMSELPDGAEWYAYNTRVMTTTELTPKEIHEIGLGEVKRIRQEMDRVIEKTGFKGSFAEFTQFLRTDPRFYYTDKESLLRGYRDIAKRTDPELIRLFGKLPRLPYGVLPVPEYGEKSQTTAYYQPGSLKAGRPGYFFANTYDLKTRPKWEMEALAMHESVPGHHLQIALAEELEGAPEFRKHGNYTAFVEGWGLYAESLGSEIGFYQDPYSKFGQLTYEMWRAIRLVVDTGMHTMGWSRQQAIDYFKANTGKTEHDITVEIDRYIVMPGQALAYKIGEMKIKELRKQATTELGAKFDVREFHDQVVDEGALPLDMLETRIKEWIAAKQK